MRRKRSSKQLFSRQCGLLFGMLRVTLAVVFSVRTAAAAPTRCEIGTINNIKQLEGNNMNNPVKSPHTTGDNFAENNEITVGMAIPDHAAQNRMPQPELYDTGIATISGVELDKTVSEVGRIPRKDSIDSLPDDVKSNIVGFADMEMDQTLLKVLMQFQYPINTDRVIMTLYFSFQKKMERTKVMRRLRMMTEEGLVYKTEGKRGLYSITDAGRAIVDS